MADFDDIDALLSNSLKSAAEPGNSAGVADAIRSRVAAGDAGTAVAGSTAPGWGGGAAGILTIVAPIALIVIAGGVGATLGVTGVFGAPLGEASGPRPYSIIDVSVSGLDCPGGTPVTDLYPGQHVLALARTEASDFVAVRDPAALDTSVWVDVNALQLADGLAGLPVSGCGELVVETPTATPTPTETTAPPPPDDDDNPPPPSDTTDPVVVALKPSKTTIYNGETVTLSYAATDNVGVTKVVLKWSNGTVTGSVNLGASGNYDWSNQGTANNTYGTYTFTATAYDAAGNKSAPVSVNVSRQYFG